MQCPNCKREYTEKPLRCSCGYDFQTGAVYAPPGGGATPLPPQAPPPTTAPHAPMQRGMQPTPARPAKRLTRLGAKLIDTLVVAAPALMMAGDDANVAVGMFVLGILALIALQWYLLSVQGQSIGKFALKIKIVKVADGTNGGFVTNVLVREIANGFLSIVPLYGLVDILFIFRKDRRCVHDHLAGTEVVDV